MSRPAKKYSHKDQKVDGEFGNIYTAFSRLDMGPFRFYYDSATDKLYLQYKHNGNSYYSSVMSIDSSGNLITTGTQTPSTPITDVGKS